MCIVIAVLNGIKISHKLFTPEMVVPSVSFVTVNLYWVYPLYPVQMWTSHFPFGEAQIVCRSNSQWMMRTVDGDYKDLFVFKLT